MPVKMLGELLSRIYIITSLEGCPAYTGVNSLERPEGKNEAQCAHMSLGHRITTIKMIIIMQSGFIASATCLYICEVSSYMGAL